MLRIALREYFLWSVYTLGNTLEGMHYVAYIAPGNTLCCVYTREYTMLCKH